MFSSAPTHIAPIRSFTHIIVRTNHVKRQKWLLVDVYLLSLGRTWPRSPHRLGQIVLQAIGVHVTQPGKGNINLRNAVILEL